MKYESKAYKVFTFFNISAIVLLCFATLFPFVYVLGRSLATDAEIMSRGLFIFPQKVTFEAYDYIIKGDSPILSGYGNTLFITIAGTFINVMLSSMVAYGISKRGLPGRKFFTFMIFFTMLFGGGMIPTFLVVRYTGLMNSLWAMIIPTAISTWNTLILRNFFMAIPESLEESAKLDGCSDIGVLFKIILPLSMPAISTIGLFYAVSHWNNWMHALLYIDDKKKWPLQMILREILASVNMLSEFTENLADNPPPAESVRTASIIVTVVPILTVYPFIQKYFVKGVMVGSVKG